MKVTLEKMQSISIEDGVLKAIEWAKSNYEKYPSKPLKPFLKKDANSKEALKYAELLNTWEQDIKKYEIEIQKWRKSKSEIDSIIEDFIKIEAEISIVPQQYRDKIYSKAYSDGHSYGYYEVYLNLCSLVEIFE